MRLLLSHLVICGVDLDLFFGAVDVSNHVPMSVFFRERFFISGAYV